MLNIRQWPGIENCISGDDRFSYTDEPQNRKKQWDHPCIIPGIGGKEGGDAIPGSPGHYFFIAVPGRNIHSSLLNLAVQTIGNFGTDVHILIHTAI